MELKMTRSFCSWRAIFTLWEEIRLQIMSNRFAARRNIASYIQRAKNKKEGKNKQQNGANEPWLHSRIHARGPLSHKMYLNSCNDRITAESLGTSANAAETERSRSFMQAGGNRPNEHSNENKI
jgi:hypothetical protein